MKYTYHIYWTNSVGNVEQFGEPLTLEWSSAEEARKPIDRLFEKPDIRAHSIMVRSEDGEVAETWFYLDGRSHRTPIQ